MFRKIKTISIIVLVFLLAGFLIIWFGNDVMIWFESSEASRSLGTVSDGWLINGKRLPSSGDNFVAFSRFAYLIGRNGVHHKVRDVVLETYQRVYQNFPQYRYVLGETSWLSGGNIKPHRTHQNGTSVDFMVPLRTFEGEIIEMDTHLFNTFGYDLEYDSTGRGEADSIDFEAMAVHLYYLQQTAEQFNITIRLVIFDPGLQKHLFSTEHGKLIKDLLPFYDQPVWVRHDEHYHVNFSVDD